MADVNTATFATAVAEASALWRVRCAEEMAKTDSNGRTGDRGSCVLGAGIVVRYLPPRCRNAIDKMIISSSDVTGAQGASIWEASTEEVICFLAERGIDASYEFGRMD